MSDTHVEKDSEVFHCIFWYHKPSFILTLLCLVEIVYYGPSVLIPNLFLLSVGVINSERVLNPVRDA